jgi:hypothetical protein
LLSRRICTGIHELEPLETEFSPRWRRCVSRCAGCYPRRTSAATRAIATCAARRRPRGGDVDGAIRCCETACGARPDSALAHRELGFRYDHYPAGLVWLFTTDAISSCGRRDDRAEVEQMIQHARILLAAQIESRRRNSSAAAVRDARIRALESECYALRRRGGARPRGAPPWPPAGNRCRAVGGRRDARHEVQPAKRWAHFPALYGTPAKGKPSTRPTRSRARSQQRGVGVRWTFGVLIQGERHGSVFFDDDLVRQREAAEKSSGRRERGAPRDGQFRRPATCRTGRFRT